MQHCILSISFVIFIGMLYYLGLNLCPVSQTSRAVLLCSMLSVPGMQDFLSGPEGHQMSL